MRLDPTSSTFEAVSLKFQVLSWSRPHMIHEAPRRRRNGNARASPVMRQAPLVRKNVTLREVLPRKASIWIPHRSSEETRKASLGGIAHRLKCKLVGRPN